LVDGGDRQRSSVQFTARKSSCPAQADAAALEIQSVDGRKWQLREGTADGLTAVRLTAWATAVIESLDLSGST